MSRAPRNPDLPIVDELRAQMRRRIIAAEVAAAKAPAAPRPHVSPPAPPARRGRERGRTVRRVTNRSLVIVALLCLIAGVALAAGLGSHDGAAPRSTSPRLLGEGRGVQLFGYRDEGRLCLRLRTAGHGAGSCAMEPDRGGLSAASEMVDGRRFVIGYAAPRIRRVGARVGRHAASAAARLPGDREAARQAGVPDRLRWFVVDLGAAGTSPARLRGFDAADRAVGGLLDCSLGAPGIACRRAQEARALGRLR
ncbi:MAG TPA: hypothetical protein VMF55_12900 [Solirubrobacterales bacterium]|nr:hypothetical protein [Solirubrobacterales bacterium]